MQLVVVCQGYCLYWSFHLLVTLCPQVGTMWGIFDKEEAEEIIPEGHRHPHYYKRRAGAQAAPHAAHAVADDDSVQTSWDGSVGGTYDDTPEDHPDGAVPARQQGMLPRAQQAQRVQEQASLRLRPFGGAGAAARV